MRTYKNSHGNVIVPPPCSQNDVTTVKSQENRQGTDKERNVGYRICERLNISSQVHGRRPA